MIGLGSDNYKSDSKSIGVHIYISTNLNQKNLHVDLSIFFKPGPHLIPDNYVDDDKVDNDVDDGKAHDDDVDDKVDNDDDDKVDHQY